MKSKTMYLEGVSQNSDSFLVDHGGVFMSPVIGTTVGQCLKNSAFGCLAKRQVHRNGSCSRGRKRSSHWKYKLETTECAELCPLLVAL